MKDTYLTQIHDYARWWRATSPAEREAQAPARLAPARAASGWYEELGLDPHEPVPARAPRITRTLLQEHAGAFIGDLTAIAEGGYLGRTSGSTGEPVEVMMCAWALAHYYMHLEWALEHADAMLPEAPRVAYVSVGTGAAPGEQAAPLWGGRVARLDGRDAAQTLAMLEEYAPDVVSCAPSDLKVLLESARAESWRGVKVILTTSEHVSASLRARVAALFSGQGQVMLNSYGLSEIGPVAWRCPRDEGGGWHVPRGSGWVERIEGELVVTTWRNRAMPLTRYASGDGVERVISLHRCERCGHVGQSFFGLKGRDMQRLYDVAGARVSPVRFIRALNDERFGVRRHGLAQERAGELMVRCEMPEEDRAELLGVLDGLMPGKMMVKLITKMVRSQKRGGGAPRRSPSSLLAGDWSVQLFFLRRRPSIMPSAASNPSPPAGDPP